MHVSDEQKFLDIFVNIKNSDNDIVDIHSTDLNLDYVCEHIDSEYLDGWSKYLNYKFDDPDLEDEENWDLWYNNLDIESIGRKDLDRFNLPTDKIELHLTNSEILVSAIYEIAKQFVDSSKKYCSKYTHVGYVFSEFLINIYFYSTLVEPSNVSNNTDSKNIESNLDLDRPVNYDLIKLKETMDPKSLKNLLAREKRNISSIRVNLKDFEVKFISVLKQFNDLQGKERINVFDISKLRINSGTDVSPYAQTTKSYFITEDKIGYTIKGKAKCDFGDDLDFVTAFFNVISDEVEY